MTLRKKTLILAGLTVGSLIFIVYAISRAVLLENYEKLEEQSARMNVARVIDALSAELSNLNNIAGDWSVWDDTYAFIQGNHDTYIQSNLVDQVFENLRVNLMLFIDDSGQMVFGKAFDLQSRQEIPVPTDVYPYFSVGSTLLNFSDTYSSRVGLIVLDKGPMLITVRPIVTSEYQGPIRGALIFGRYLNHDEVERLMEITHLKFTINRFGDAQTPQELIQMATAAQEETLSYVQPVSIETVAGYTLIRDIFEKPAFFLRVELPREIYQQGLNTISYFGYLLVFVGLAFGLVAIFLLEKIILSRVANLNESVRLYGVNGNLAGRLVVAGNDELSSLGDEINKMLEALGKSERALRESERRNLLRAIPDQMFVFTREGKCVDYKVGDEELLSGSTGGYTGKYIHDFGFSTENLLTALSNIQKALELNTVQTSEYEFIQAEPLHFEARFVALNENEVLAIFRNVTERVKAQKALDRSERLYRTLFECANDAIFLINLDGVYTAVNEKAADLLGYKREDLVGKEISNVAAPSEYPDSMKVKQKLLAGESMPLYERIFQKKDGTRFPVEINASLVLDLDGSPMFIQSVVRDITERKQKEMQIQRQVKRLNAIRDIDQAIKSSLDLRLTLDILLSQIIDQLGVDAVDILLFNPYTRMLDITTRRGFHTGALRYTHLRLGESYAGRAALEQRIVHVPDLTETPGDLSQAVLLASEGFKTYYAVPLIAKGQVKGVLEIFQRAILEPDPEWEEFLESLAAQAAIAMDNAQMFRDLQRVNLELSLAYDATLEGWAKALELRDKETEGHSQRVTEMTVKMGQAMGMQDEELVQVRRGALLHDIGKMGIPDSILLKPGPLTDEEWVIMRKHPVYAYDLLSPIPYLRPALDIPYGHHEKWDGTGYPQGLKSQQIPLAARIFSVVDVWDALSSDRPYRTAWSKEKVYAELQKQIGKHFDPQIVQVFLDLLDSDE